MSTGVKPPREACRTIIVLTPLGLSSPSMFKVSAEERAARLEEVVTTLDAPHLRASSIVQRLEEGNFHLALCNYLEYLVGSRV